MLDGVADDPAQAMKIANLAVSEDPEFAYNHGMSLITILAGRGDFAAAVEFAGDGPEEQRNIWASAAFKLWTDRAPRDAVTAIIATTPGEDRDGRLEEVMRRWSTADPAAAVQFAATFTVAEDRRRAFACAIGNWVRRDPAGASAWINQQEPSSDVDEGVAAVATTPALAMYRPAVALEWAKSIVDPNIRLYALITVLQTWAQVDASAANSYLSFSPDVTAADRKMLLDEFESLRRRRQIRQAQTASGED